MSSKPDFWLKLDQRQLEGTDAEMCLEYSTLRTVFRVSVSDGEKSLEEAFCMSGDYGDENFAQYILDNGVADVDSEVADRIAERLAEQMEAGLKNE